MPHVFTLEGNTPAQLAGLSANIVSYPPGGSAISPATAVIGPTRVATQVFGPGGTPVMFRRRYPARGPVCDYCDPNYFTVMNGGLQVIPQQQQLGDVVDFLRQRNPIVAGLMVIGGSLATGAILGGLAIFLMKKAGYQTPKAYDHDW